jgi:hypothetical protein
MVMEMKIFVHSYFCGFSLSVRKILEIWEPYEHFLEAKPRYIPAKNSSKVFLKRCFKIMLTNTPMRGHDVIVGQNAFHSDLKKSAKSKCYSTSIDFRIDDTAYGVGMRMGLLGQ